MRILAVALLLVLGSAPALAQSRFVDTKLWGVNVQLALAVMKNVKDTKKCTEADWKKFTAKAREMAITLEPTAADWEKMRKAGADPSKPGEFLRFEFGVACFKDRKLGIKFPLNGKGKQIYLYSAERGWYS